MVDRLLAKLRGEQIADFFKETDWIVGQVVQAHDAAGIAANTIVLFSAYRDPVTEGYLSLPAAGGGRSNLR